MQQKKNYKVGFKFTKHLYYFDNRIDALSVLALASVTADCLTPVSLSDCHCPLLVPNH